VGTFDLVSFPYKLYRLTAYLFITVRALLGAEKIRNFSFDGFKNFIKIKIIHKKSPQKYVFGI